MENLPIETGISWILMSSYLYYELAKPILSDQEYDSLCQYLVENFDKVKSSKHPHKHLITLDVLQTTGHSIKYPNFVRRAAVNWTRKEALNLLYKVQK